MVYRYPGRSGAKVNARRGGWLTGKYQREMQEPSEGTRADRDETHGGFNGWSLLDCDHTWNVLDAVGGVAAETGGTHAQVALPAYPYDFVFWAQDGS